MASLDRVCHVNSVLQKKQGVFNGIKHHAFVIKEHILQSCFALGGTPSMFLLILVDCLFYLYPLKGDCTIIMVSFPFSFLIKIFIYQKNNKK